MLYVNWKSRELEIAKERLKHKALVGTVAVGRAGLGYCTNKDIRIATGKEYRHLLQNEVRAGVEELIFGKMDALGQRGVWTRWDDILKRKGRPDTIPHPKLFMIYY